MPESGPTPSNQPSIVSTPIENLPSNTSPRSNQVYETVEFAGLKELPKPENLSEYYQASGSPYAFEYFKVDKTVQNVKTYIDYAQSIDDFINKEIELKSLNNSFDTYGHIVDDLLNELNLNPDTNELVKIEKLYKWIKKVVGPQRDLELRKKKIIYG